jgi:hypothetical protein
MLHAVMYADIAATHQSNNRWNRVIMNATSSTWREIQKMIGRLAFFYWVMSSGNLRNCSCVFQAFGEKWLGNDFPTDYWMIFMHLCRRTVTIFYCLFSLRRSVCTWNFILQIICHDYLQKMFLCKHRKTLWASAFLMFASSFNDAIYFSGTPA